MIPRLWQITPGATTDIKDSNCTKSGVCPPESRCDKSNGICYWNVPTPSTGNFRIPKGASSDIVWSILPNSNEFVTSGNLRFCLEGSCSGSAEVCDSGGECTAGGDPITLGECPSHGHCHFEGVLVRTRIAVISCCRSALASTQCSSTGTGTQSVHASASGIRTV